MKHWNPISPEMQAVIARIEAGPPPTTAELADIAGFDTSDLSGRLAAYRRRGYLVRDLRMRDTGGPGQPTEAVWRLA